MTVEMLQKHFPFWKRKINFFPETPESIKIFPVLFTYVVSFFQTDSVGAFHYFQQSALCSTSKCMV